MKKSTTSDILITLILIQAFGTAIPAVYRVVIGPFRALFVMRVEQLKGTPFFKCLRLSLMTLIFFGFFQLKIFYKLNKNNVKRLVNKMNRYKK